MQIDIEDERLDNVYTFCIWDIVIKLINKFYL